MLLFTEMLLGCQKPHWLFRCNFYMGNCSKPGNVIIAIDKVKVIISLHFAHFGGKV